MKRSTIFRALVLGVATAVLAGCGAGWQGANSLPLPGTAGSGPQSYAIDIEMPDVASISRNSRVLLDDVNVGTVDAIRLENWHAVVTVRLDGDVRLPVDTTARVGQTSLLGALHIELSTPMHERAVGTLRPGSRIPISRAGVYPTTEQTLATVSTVLNGGGIGQLQDVNVALAQSLSGHESEVRHFLSRLNTFVSRLNAQRHDIIAAMSGVDQLAGRVNDRTPILEQALDRVPTTLAILDRQHDELVHAVTSLGTLARDVDGVVRQSRASVADDLRSLQPVLRELADAGPALTRALPGLITPPFPTENVGKFLRGDYANLSATIDLTLGRIDNSLLQRTPVDGALTAIERAMGRRTGLAPTPDTTNPLTAPLARVAQRG